ncbi:MAG: thioredoxin domain-containing protein [Vicinamibacterales bacterium]
MSAFAVAALLTASIVSAQTPAARAGAENAPVVVSVYADLDAPQGAPAAVVARVLLDRYPGRVAVHFHHRPADGTVHAADAAVVAAAAQQRGWEMAELLLANQGQRDPGALSLMARMLELNLDAFAAAMADPNAAAAVVQADAEEVARLRLAADTVLVVNGEAVKTMTSEIERRFGSLLGAPTDPSR